MTPDRQRAREIFLHAVGQLPPGQWDEYAAGACAGDAELHRLVRQLFEAHRQAGSFLERPVAAPPALDPTTAPLDAAAETATGTAGEAFGAPGVVAGRYEFREGIGQGGMGTVFRARDLRLNRDVAVKLLQEKYAPASLGARRFVEEAQITGQLQHPGIPPVHEVGELPDGRPFLAMKLIKGRTLAEILADGAAGRGSLVAVFEQVCQAVAYAHARGVIHRDLKPANVMVGAFGEVQVMDWGLAKVRTDARGESVAAASTFRDPRDDTDQRLKTQAGSFLGTPAYMSPEQAIGAVDQIDERADVFGLGAVLCVILTGQPPFVGDTAESARQLAAQGKLGDAFARLAGCGAEPELVALCTRCLSAEKADRPRNAGEVAAAVHAFRVESEERARRAELERARAEVAAAEQRKRRRVQAALAAAVLVLAAGGGAFAWWRNHVVEEARLKQAQFDGEQKAQQAAFDTERKLKAEQAQERARNLLAFAADARKEYRYDAALAALREAGELAANLAPQFLADVRQAQADFAFVVELDAIRMKRSAYLAEPGGKGHFDDAAAPPAYRAAFAARGLDVIADPAAAAQRVASAAVRGELVIALDDWAILETDVTVRDKVLSVLRRVDPDSGAAPFRDPAVWPDRAALEALAAQVDVGKMSPGAVVAIAGVMGQQKADAAPLLRRALSLYPREFLVAFTLGQILFRRDQKDPEAVGAYRAARAIRPDNVSVLTNLGLVLTASGDRPGAIAAFEEATKADPKFATAHNNLGLALRESGNLPGAIAEYREAVRLDPKDAKAQINLGIALKDSGDLPGAIAAFEGAIKADPKFAPAHNGLGAALAASGDRPGAIAEYREAIKLDPKLAKAHYNLGLALSDSGDLPGAIAEYREAIKLDPKDAMAHTNLGAALSDSGDLPGAIVEHRAAIKADPKFAPAHYNLGVVLAASGDLPGAIAAYREAIKANPKDAAAHNNLGIALKDSGNLPGAIAAFEEAVRADPKLVPAHNNLGLTLAASGNLLGAIAAFKEAVKANPKDVQAHYNLGIALKLSGDLPGAIAEYKEAVKADPKDASAHRNLGVIYFEQKKYPEAIACARAAIAADPKLAEAHALLGDLLRRTGDIPGARAALTEAARLDKRWEKMLAQLPRVEVAPQPREVKQ